MIFKVYISVVLIMTGFAFAAPALLVDRSTAVQASTQDSMISTARIAQLPGMNNVMRNTSSMLLDTTPSDAAFGSRCRYLALGGHGKKGHTTLESTCSDDSGQWWQTSLNLNKCIANEEGYLVYYDKGNFDKLCRPCTINSIEPGSDVLLKCNCQERPDGVPKFTSLQLGLLIADDRAVKPVDGRLVCGTNTGTKSPVY